MNYYFFAPFEWWLFDQKEQYLLNFYHPQCLDKNEQYEEWWPCSDEARFWPPILVQEQV